MSTAFPQAICQPSRLCPGLEKKRGSAPGPARRLAEAARTWQSKPSTLAYHSDRPGSRAECDIPASAHPTTGPGDDPICFPLCHDAAKRTFAARCAGSPPARLRAGGHGLPGVPPWSISSRVTDAICSEQDQFGRRRGNKMRSDLRKGSRDVVENTGSSYGNEPKTNRKRCELGGIVHQEWEG